MTIDTQKLRELVADVNAASEAHGETDWYTQGIIYIDPDGIGKADSHLIAHLSPERVTAIADHIDAQGAQLAAYQADWREDSSLETWFPLTAAQLKAQAAEIDGLRAELEHQSAYSVTHKGRVLICSGSMRDAYSNEAVRADAADAEIARLREALEWYQGKSKAMASAAISGDRKAMIDLMQEIAVDYGKRASAALAQHQGEKHDTNTGI